MSMGITTAGSIGEWCTVPRLSETGNACTAMFVCQI